MHPKPGHNSSSSHGHGRGGRLRRRSNLQNWRPPHPELTPEQRMILERSKAVHPSAQPPSSEEEGEQ